MWDYANIWDYGNIKEGQAAQNGKDLRGTTTGKCRARRMKREIELKQAAGGYTSLMNP